MYVCVYIFSKYQKNIDCYCCPDSLSEAKYKHLLLKTPHTSDTKLRLFELNLTRKPLFSV